MSVLVVNADHVDLLVSAAVEYGRGGTSVPWVWGNPSQSRSAADTDPSDVAQMLTGTNFAAFNHRYGEHNAEPRHEYRPVRPLPPPVQIIKAVNCFEYQCDGLPGWAQSEAQAFCAALAAAAIRKLDGYNAAAWTWARSKPGVAA